jgi:hypothetical protein
MHAYPEHITLGPLDHAGGTVRLPGSKSISNRILLLAALAKGRTRIHDLLVSDDVERMLEALGLLGIKGNTNRRGIGGGRGMRGHVARQGGRLVPGQRRYRVPATDGSIGDMRRPLQALRRGEDA